MKHYEQLFNIKSFDIDFNHDLKLSTLFSYMQNVAEEHAGLLGAGYDRLVRDGMFWILSRIKLYIKRIPKWKETIKLETWAKGVDRLFALRDFLVFDSDNNIIISVTQNWLLLSVKNLRPLKIESIGDFLNDPTTHAIDEKLDKLVIPENVSIIDKITKNVRTSDIDIYFHVNNAKYIDWISDMLVDEFLNKQKILSLEVNFLSEIKINSKIELIRSKCDDGFAYVESKEFDTGKTNFTSKVSIA